MDLLHNRYYPSWILSTADTLHHGFRQYSILIAEEREKIQRQSFSL